MAGEFHFLSWRWPAIHRFAPQIGPDGRRGGTINFAVQVTDEAPQTGGAPFLVEGPRDIGRIDGSAIVRTAPPPNEPAAETTKLVHVDFTDADFPWRYTLASPGDAAGHDPNKKLRPWVVLVVGTDDEIDVNGGTLHIKNGNFLKDPNYDLSGSWLWAHVQVHQGREHGRLLAPRRLQPQTAYTAVLVPAYNNSGSNSWSNASVPQSLPALYSWKFQTTEAGDFETLVSALQVRPEGDLGKVTVNYKLADATSSQFAVYGAIAPRTRPPLTEEQKVALNLIRSDLGPKVTEEDSVGEAPAIGLPLYGRPWVNKPSSTTTWGHDIFDDPRLRVAAGIGMWMGIEAQEQLLAAGIEQAGALGVARRRVASLVAGFHSNGSLQQRRLPESPLARLWVLSPVMARLPATINGTSAGSVLSALVDGDSPLPAALFSSAAKRLLKRGGSPTRYIRDPDPQNPNQSRGATRDEILKTANTCPPAEDDRQLDDTNVAREKLKDVLRAYANQLDLSLQDIPIAPVEPPRPEPCRGRRLEVLVKGIQAALDPANVVDRVAGTVSPINIRSLAPPELPITLQYPTWLLLKERAREWLLPGFDRIAKSSVISLATNPEFIEAFLLGLNTQYKDELHWRQLADAPANTPFTLFWGMISGKGDLAKRTPDMKPIADWPADSKFGLPEHQFVLPADDQGNRDLVILLRTDLFRRYPTTQVYLRRIPTDADAAATGSSRDNLEKQWLETIGPGDDVPPPISPTKIDSFPIFQALFSADVVFFIFNVNPDDLDKFWLMLEEPPADLRFRTPRSLAPPDDTQAPIGDVASSANFAGSTLDHPTRVAISWSSLKGGPLP